MYVRTLPRHKSEPSFKRYAKWMLAAASACRRGILIVFADQRVQLLRGDRPLPILNDIPLSLTVTEVFSWLEL